MQLANQYHPGAPINPGSNQPFIQPPRHTSYPRTTNTVDKNLLPTPAASATPELQEPRTSNFENPRAHHDVASRFKNQDSKYSGHDEECLQEFIDVYQAVADDYSLSARQKKKYLHNLFRGKALRFYNRSVKDSTQTYGEAIHKIVQHFNSLDVQQRVKSNLQNLKLQDFVDKTRSVVKGLSALATHLSNHITQCHTQLFHT